MVKDTINDPCDNVERQNSFITAACYDASPFTQLRLKPEELSLGLYFGNQNNFGSPKPQVFSYG